MDTPVPSLASIGLQVLQCLLIMEVWFYSAHRLFHWGPLYRRFHKRHHEFTVRRALYFPLCFPPSTPSLLTARFPHETTVISTPSFNNIICR